MSDSYLNFANSRFGAKLTSMLGLPRPLVLDRFSSNQPNFEGDVLVGRCQKGEIFDVVVSMLASIGANPLQHSTTPDDASIGDWNGVDKVKGLIFDASNLRDSDSSVTLHQFFSSAVKSVLPNGRVIVLGRPPESCAQASHSTMQRALEGLTRSLAKELKKAITVQLVYVECGAEQKLESTIRFLLSPKSAYVSGQVIRVSMPVCDHNEVDWNQPLSGKKILVTGASQGIGLAIAEVATRDGAHVICLDIPTRKEALADIAKKLGGSFIALDLSSESAPSVLQEAAANDAGWNAIIHNAGITKDKTIAKMEKHWWSQVVDINLGVQERINRALIDSKGLRSGGTIVCVSSISGIAGNRGQTNYAFSKAGVIGMVESQAPILREQGITINAVAPGFIETQMTSVIPFSVREAGRRLNSLSQGGLPVDVAETVAWFASSGSSGVSGNVVRVCGQSLLGA
ncbi:3-oxoacyl-ACP reductase [Arenicella sp. 4NH20-0111]|uniref:3-oxoacyl-ACP reductase n=1 Tax=Arenicella sp. 4NH20-0111 TaxID=3127648 RepID=UPI003107569E